MPAIRTALISVSNKQGIVRLARALSDAGVELLSTGGTAGALRGAGLEVTDVSTYTDSPEVMDGRVKTLHPRIHGGILMRDCIGDRTQLTDLGGKAIDLVVVNLYPFEETVARGAQHDEVIENIDIGGPSMIRSAAKNHARVSVVTDPDDYERVAASLPDGPDASLRAALALKAFRQTAAYDAAITAYLSRAAPVGAEEPREFPRDLTLRYELGYDLRYGENPHQPGAFYVSSAAPAGSLARAESLDVGKKELSFNNLVDVDAALEAVREFAEPAAVVVKHTNPCGVAVADGLEAAYRSAREADPVSAFGGIVALNRRVDAATAAALSETFLECVVAPGFDEDALGLLRDKKKSLRLLATGEWLDASRGGMTFKAIDGGLAAHRRDATARGEVRGGRVVTKRAPTDAEIDALELAWAVVKHVKSNAIVLAKAGRTVGVGAGQTSRVTAVELAAKLAGDDAKGAVLASDAFFPFADGLLAGASAGCTAVAQPGGSKRDEEVIAAADEAGLAMVFTGARHFRH